MTVRLPLGADGLWIGVAVGPSYGRMVGLTRLVSPGACEEGSLERSVVLPAIILTVFLFTSVGVNAGSRARRGTAWWVVSKLPTPGEQLTLRVSATRRAWNPAEPPGVDNGIFGPGVASYTRERRAEGDVIHLEFEPRGAPTRHFSGPIPESAVPGSATNARARRALPIATSMMVAPTVLVGLGAIFAIIQPSGARRPWFVGGFVLLALFPAAAVTLVRVVQAFRRTARGSQK